VAPLSFDTGCGAASLALQAGDGSATQFDAAPGATGVSLLVWTAPDGIDVPE
jgi:hypothetical protein